MPTTNAAPIPPVGSIEREIADIIWSKDGRDAFLEHARSVQASFDTTSATHWRAWGKIVEMAERLAAAPAGRPRGWNETTLVEVLSDEP